MGCCTANPGNVLVWSGLNILSALLMLVATVWMCTTPLHHTKENLQCVYDGLMSIPPSPTSPTLLMEGPETETELEPEPELGPDSKITKTLGKVLDHWNVAAIAPGVLCAMFLGAALAPGVPPGVLFRWPV